MCFWIDEGRVEKIMQVCCVSYETQDFYCSTNPYKCTAASCAWWYSNPDRAHFLWVHIARPALKDLNCYKKNLGRWKISKTYPQDWWNSEIGEGWVFIFEGPRLPKWCTRCFKFKWKVLMKNLTLTPHNIEFHWNLLDLQYMLISARDGKLWLLIQ